MYFVKECTCIHLGFIKLYSVTQTKHLPFRMIRKSFDFLVYIYDIIQIYQQPDLF